MAKSKKIQKILIANRGEISRRILRTLRRLNIESIVIYHQVDAHSPFVAEADVAMEIMGATPTSAYLDIKQIVDIASNLGADAVHPGYGFLAENGDFAEAVAAAGMIFIGPKPDAIRLLGDKVAAREFVAKHGFPLAPSVSSDDGSESLLEAAREIGFPILIKAAAGGGGKGMHIVHQAEDFQAAFQLASSEAARYFGDERVYCEKYLARPRHIEVQILADEHGHCIHIGERECSVQRRFQKLIEETPAPNLSKLTREKICKTAVDIAKAANYTNAGTVEFIMGEDETFFFLEMNTRLQVEHPVTEMVMGIDLVEAQINVASGAPLSLSQADITPRGHAIELRICAEDADADFMPATGRICCLKEAELAGIRFDSSLHEGSEVTTAFDPMLAKLIAHAESRDAAREKLINALDQQIILGVTTNSAFLRRVLANNAFAKGHIHTHFIEDHKQELARAQPSDETLRVILAAAALNDVAFRKLLSATPQPIGSMGGWRNA